MFLTSVPFHPVTSCCTASIGWLPKAYQSKVCQSERQRLRKLKVYERFVAMGADSDQVDAHRGRFVWSTVSRLELWPSLEQNSF